VSIDRNRAFPLPGARRSSTTRSSWLARGAIVALVASAAACAPAIDGPIEHQRAIDRDDGERLASQLRLLPGVVAASVVLHHPARDPLALAPPSPPECSAVIVTDDRAATGAIRDAAGRLARAAVPELTAAALAIEVEPAIHRAELAKLGPFWVEASSRTSLRALLALGCLAIAGLAVALAVRTRRYRRGSSAQ
jgi:type III secretory pathway lipoprotein EscJ